MKHEGLGFNVSLSEEQANSYLSLPPFSTFKKCFCNFSFRDMRTEDSVNWNVCVCVFAGACVCVLKKSQKECVREGK